MARFRNQEVVKISDPEQTIQQIDKPRARPNQSNSFMSSGIINLAESPPMSKIKEIDYCGLQEWQSEHGEDPTQ